ncbi:MAG: SOS response-associated peptidase, partial [Anaerolineae bacterium]
MCGRFTLATPTDILLDLFDIQGDQSVATPRYNIAPTQPVSSVRLVDERAGRELVELHWGLIPFWAKDPDIGSRMINARAESVAEKPAFRAAFKRRRCLIPADGFYEWQKRDGAKQPYYFRLVEERPMALAGLWEHWESGDGSVVESCTIITTTANDLVLPVHGRMPAILPEADHELWLDPAVDDRGALEAVLGPYDATAMTVGQCLENVVVG